MLEKGVEYDKKSIWVDQAIEKHYRFFRNDYIARKKVYFELLSKVRAIEEATDARC